MSRARRATVVVGTRAVVARAAATPDTSRPHGRLGGRLAAASRATASESVRAHEPPAHPMRYFRRERWNLQPEAEVSTARRGSGGGGDLRFVEVGLGALDQRGGRGEALAVLLGELLGALDEAGEAAFVAVDVLEDASGPAREPDAHDR